MSFFLPSFTHKNYALPSVSNVLRCEPGRGAHQSNYPQSCVCTERARFEKKQHVDLIGFVRFLDEKRNDLLDNDGVPIRKRCKTPLDEQINDVPDNDGVPLKKRRKTSG